MNSSITVKNMPNQNTHAIVNKKSTLIVDENSKWKNTDTLCKIAYLYFMWSKKIKILSAWSPLLIFSAGKLLVEFPIYLYFERLN